MRYKNIPIGTRFDNLVVISFARIGDRFHAEWNCICDCGKETVATGHALRKGRKRSCGHLFTTAGTRSSNFKDLSGQVFGSWTVTNQYEVRTKKSGKKTTYWLCRCSCGLEKFVIGGQLVYGSTTACKKCGSRRLPFGESARRAVLQQYKDGAEERGLSWSLNELLFDSITKQNCSYCGLPPSNKHSLSDGSSFVYMGIDRINNFLGYEESNVVPCCRVCNRAKDVRTREEFLAWAKRIVNNNESGPNSRYLNQ